MNFVFPLALMNIEQFYFAVDNYSFIQSKRVILLNSFVKKGTKQYKAEIKLAERLLKKYLEG